MKNLSLVCSMMAISLSVATARDIHIAPSGSDSNEGTPDAPLKTLHAAQRVVRAAKQGGMPEDGINVILHSGIYAITQPLFLGVEDSGEPEKPITWKAANNAKPVITIYTDEGTAYLRFADNVLDGDMGTWRIFQRGRENRHKRFENNYWHRYPNGRTREKGNYEIEDPDTVNIGGIQTDRAKTEPPRALESWTEAARKIIMNAGLEPEYKHLLKCQQFIGMCVPLQHPINEYAENSR